VFDIRLQAIAFSNAHRAAYLLKYRLSNNVGDYAHVPNYSHVPKNPVAPALTNQRTVPRPEAVRVIARRLRSEGVVERRAPTYRAHPGYPSPRAAHETCFRHSTKPARVHLVP